MKKGNIQIIFYRPRDKSGVLLPECAAMIERVSPRIRLQDISQLVEAEKNGDEAARRQLDVILAETEIMYGCPLPPDGLRRAPKLKWIQNPLAGVDMFLKPDFVASPVVLTNAKGIHDHVAEVALMLALMLSKNAAACLQNKTEGRWQQFTPGHLSGKTMGVIGLGQIGSKIARLGKAFHMRTMATEIRSLKKPPYLDVLLPAEELSQLLAQSDFVIITVPSIGDTAKMIGEKEIRMMKSTAFLINISRGKVVNEEVLIRALNEKWISGAGLDVFTREPLEENSPLWSLPNVIITPHFAGLRDDYDLLTARLFCKNLRRYLRGQELLNVVDKVKGF